MKWIVQLRKFVKRVLRMREAAEEAPAVMNEGQDVINTLWALTRTALLGGVTIQAQLDAKQEVAEFSKAAYAYIDALPSR